MAKSNDTWWVDIEPRLVNDNSVREEWYRFMGKHPECFDNQDRLREGWWRWNAGEDW